MPVRRWLPRIGLGLFLMLAVFPGTVIHTLAQTKTPDWTIRGEAVVTCPCRVPCPCRSNARASQPHCENLSYVHVVEGNYGTVKLDRLKYVWAADECTGRHPVEKPTALYFPQNASQAQMDAVERIMNAGTCAGHPSAAMKARRVALSAGANGSLYFAQAPTGTRSHMLRLAVDIAPGPLPMEPLPALDLWGNTVSYAQNLAAQIDDSAEDLHWDYSGRQANYRTFEARSNFVGQGLLLALFRDDIGTFNQMHRSLIRELHLEVPLGREDFNRMLAQVHVPAKAVPGRWSEDAHGAIGGRVLDPEGKPRSGARIHLQPDGSGFEQVAVTNPAGRYFLAHVPVGGYQVCASTWDGKTATRGCEGTKVAAGQIVNRELHLHPAAR